MFQEQVGAVSLWFTEWTEAEQMVLLYSLLKRLSPLQVRFLSRVVDQHMTDCNELQLLEQQANNPGFISSLVTKSKDVAMTQLLILLPLLTPGNTEAKSRYIDIIPTILSHSVETGQHLPQAKQLISYSLIHPAISSDDRKHLTPWVQILKTRFNVSSTPVLPLADATNWSNKRQIKDSLGFDCNIYNQTQSDLCLQYSNQMRVRRSNSLTPPFSATQPTELWASQDDLCAKQKPRSFSLSSDHVPPLSPQSSQASSGSGSESQLDESKSFTSDLPGMKDVGPWLKTLRLHKYLWLFAQLSYDEMLSMTEEKLEASGVTKGARHKIILSVRKLKDRHNALLQLEKDVMRGANLMNVLEELKLILCSPIKPLPIENNETAVKSSSEEDIPAQFTKVMGKVCTHIIVNGVREEELARQATMLLEKCLLHEAFIAHRRRLDTWRLQVQSLCQHTHLRQRWYNQGQYNQSSGISALDTRSLRKPTTYQASRSLYQPITTQTNLLSTPQFPTSQPIVNTGSQQMNNLHLNFSLSTTNNVPNVSPVLCQNEGFSMSTSPSSTIKSCENLLEVKSTLQDYGSQEAIPVAGVQRNKSPPTKPSDPDINSRLEDLCLSMAEHFLGGVS